MPNLWRVVGHWAGGKIGSGFTNLFFTEGIGTAVQASDAAAAFLRSSYGIGGQFLPTGVTISFTTAVDVIADSTGALLNTVSVTQPADITGGDASAYAAPAGAVVTWKTNGVVGGHRVRGRTFLVPAGGAGLQNDGSLSSNFQSAINGAATALIAATPEFVVWHRPISLTSGGGESHPVTSYSLQDKAAMLTSRR